MLNFTVGPVQASTEICLMGSQQVPYFRTSEFSEMMLESEGLIKKFANIVAQLSRQKSEIFIMN